MIFVANVPKILPPPSVPYSQASTHAPKRPFISRVRNNDSVASASTTASARDGSLKRTFKASNDTNTEWKTVSKKNRAVRGKNQNCELKGGKNFGEIFVSHIEKGTTGDAVKSFLEDKNYEVVECEKVSHEKSTFDSFRVKLLDSHCSYLVSDKAAEDLWGENIMCRRFYRSRGSMGESLSTRN